MKPKVNIEEILKAKQSFEVPKGYFEEMQKQVLANVNQEKEKPKGKTIRWSWIATSIAASTILFCVFWFKNQSSPTYASSTNMDVHLEQIITPKAELASILDEDGVIELTDEELFEISEETHPENQQNNIINYLNESEIDEEELIENI